MGAFGFIGPEHPFFPQLEPLREAVRGAAALGENVSDRSLIRIDVSGPAPKLKWAYVSRQSCVGAFRATTLFCRSDRGRAERFEFPRDPKLSLRNELPSEFEMLRYVPRRRVTIKSKGRVGKFIRPTELADVVERLTTASRILSKSEGLALPRILEQRPVAFFEEFLMGENFVSLLKPSNCELLMEVAAQIARRIHRHLPVGLPGLGMGTLLQNSARDQAMLVVFRPELNRWLAGIMELLRLRFSDLPSETAFCHGDFRAPHLLSRPKGDWAVVDFDGAVAGDPHWEHALFITSLKRELPIFSDANLHEAAAEAYVAGYEREGGRVNREHLRWFRLAAEIHFLARSFQRDLYTPELFTQSVCAIARLAGVGAP